MTVEQTPAIRARHVQAGNGETVTVFSTVEGDGVVARQLKHIIKAHSEHAPRSQQKRIGPSEVGDECVRKVAFKLAGAPVHNGMDSWPATVGTAVHTWLDEAIRAEGSPGEWFTETKLLIDPDLTGRCDAYHLPSHTVVDHKVAGAKMLREVKANGPSDVYRTQIHLYGLGWANAGYIPEQVAIVYHSKSGWLKDMHVWSEPWSPERAEQALAKLTKIRQLVFQLDGVAHPENLLKIPATPGPYGCTTCPFYNPGSSELGCPGNTSTTT